MILKIPCNIPCYRLNLRPCLRPPPPPIPPRPSPQPQVFPPRATQMSVEHADLSEYTVPLEAMPGLSDTRCPLGIGHIALDPMTPRFGPSDLAEFEIPALETGIHHGGPISSGLCADDPPTQWVRSCVELPSYARSWVPEPSPTHSTVLYKMMQVNGSLEAQVAHGRACTKQT